MVFYQVVAQTLRQRLDEGFYGKKLPSIGALAAEFRVTGNTIQRALNILKNENRLYSMNGQGTFVTDSAAGSERRIVTVFARNFMPNSNPFYSYFLEALRLELAVAGIGINISLNGRMPDPRTCQAVLILCRGLNHIALEELQRRILPEKIYYVDLFRPDLPLIACDNFAAGRQAIDYLHSRGHRQIGILAYDQQPDISFYERVRGARAAADGYPDVTLDVADLGNTQQAHDSGRLSAALDRWLAMEKPPTAIFALTDQLAIETLAALRNRNIAVPDEISVLGYDNRPFASLFTPPLTTFEESYVELAKAAAARLEHPHRRHGEPLQIYIPPRLVERRSVADRSWNRHNLNQEHIS